MKKIKIDPSAAIKRLNIITNRFVNTQIVGGYRSVFKGRGLEFFDYRHYTPNDDASTIDWKASVKSNELLVKEFVEERNLNVCFLIDVSSSMLCASIDKLKIEYSAELIATLSFAVARAGDSISFAFFNDKVVRYEPPRMGFKQYYNLLRSFVEPKYYGGGYDLTEALKFIMASLKEFSIVIIVSDFIGLKNDWQHYLKIAGKKYDLIGIMIRDPIDRHLPDYDGNVLLTDSFSSKQMVVSVNSIKDNYARYVESQEKEVAMTFTNAGADFLELTTDKPFVKPITDLFIKRGKRIR